MTVRTLSVILAIGFAACLNASSRTFDRGVADVPTFDGEDAAEPDGVPGPDVDDEFPGPGDSLPAPNDTIQAMTTTSQHVTVKLFGDYAQ